MFSRIGISMQSWFRHISIVRRVPKESLLLLQCFLHCILQVHFRRYNSSWNLDSWERLKGQGAFLRSTSSSTTRVGAAFRPFALSSCTLMDAPHNFQTCFILSKSWKLRSANFPEIQIAVLRFYQCFISLLSQLDGAYDFFSMNISYEESVIVM